MNTLQQIEQLAVKAVAENQVKQDIYQLTNLVNISLIKKFDELEAYCDVVEAGRELAEANITDNTMITSKLESTCNAYELLMNDNAALEKKLAVANNTISSNVGTNKKITDQAIEIRELSVYKRKFEVAEKNWKSALDKLQTMKDKAVQVKPVTGGVKQKAITSKQLKHATANLVNENAFYRKKYKDLADDYNGLIIHLQTAPTFAGDVKIKGAGNIHMIDLQWHDREIKQEDGSFLKTRAQHVLCINDWGSVKTLFRIEGDETIHVSQTPVGKHLRASDALTQIVRDRFSEYDKNYKVRDSKKNSKSKKNK